MRKVFLFLILTILLFSAAITETQGVEVIRANSLVYWTNSRSGKVYHTHDDCETLNRIEELVLGTVEQAISAGRTRLCVFCARRDNITGIKEYNYDDRKEILFRNIPWAVSYKQIIEKYMANEEWSTPNATTTYNKNIAQKLYKFGVSADDSRYYRYLNFEDTYTFRIRAVMNRPNLFVGGHPLRAMEMYFTQEYKDGFISHNREDAILYLCKYEFTGMELIGDDFAQYEYNSSEITNDLRQKLVSLYGNPDEEQTTTNERNNVKTDTVYWYGANGSFVCLSHEDTRINNCDEGEVNIYYGNLNGFSKLLTTFNYIVSIENGNIFNNTDGL